MSTATVTTIDPLDKRALKRFLSLERQLMNEHPYYISELDSDVAGMLTRKAAMAQEMEFRLFIVSQAGRDLCRCAASISSKFQAQKQPGAGFIGYFAAAKECEEAVALMMGEAESWLKEKGVTRVIAPANGPAPNSMGFRIDGFEEDPMFPFAWTPPYYPAYFRSLGYRPTYPLWYYDIDFSSEQYRAAKQQYAGYDAAVIRPVSKKRWSRDIETVCDMLNETFVDEWEFVRVSHTEMKEFMAPMKDALAPQQILIAEVDGKPAGFCFAVPDLTPLFRSFNGKIGLIAIIRLLTGAAGRFNRAGILGIGVTDEHKGKGLARAIAVRLYGYHESLGLKSSLYFPVNEHNTASRRFAESIGGTGRHLYQVYDKMLS